MGHFSYLQKPHLSDLDFFSNQTTDRFFLCPFSLFQKDGKDLRRDGLSSVMFSILGSNFCTPKTVLLLSFEKTFILAFDTNSVDLPEISLFCPLYLFYTYLGTYY